MTYQCLKCQGNMRGIFNHISIHKLDNKGNNPVLLKSIEQNFEIDPKAFLCPINKETYIYFSYAKKDDEILLSDSVPTHPVIREGFIGWCDFFTYRLFAPKGRMVFHSGGFEGFLTEPEFQKKIEEQKNISNSSE